MALELRNIVKRVGGETYIYDTSLTLAEQGFNILLGTTLAGKTTLMQLMAGLEQPSSGEIWFDGRNVTGVSVQKRNVAMVYQQFINYPNFTVFENIASPLRVVRMQEEEIGRRVGRVAELLQLTPLLGRQPLELSGGQQQRTALARALVKDADLVLLDEPLANLDFKLREGLRDEMPRLFADRKCTVVYATTDPTEALLLGGYTATLDQGRITQFGPTVELYRRPVDIITAQVFSDPPINTAPVTKKDGRIELGSDVSWPIAPTAAGLPDGRYVMGIRPHHIRPFATGADTARIDGEVQITELSGSESVIYFSHHGLNWVSQSHGIHPIKVGETAGFHIDVKQCLYFSENGERIAP